MFGQFTTFKVTTFFSHIFIASTKIVGPNTSAGVTIAAGGQVVAFLPVRLFLVLLGLEFFHEDGMILAHLCKALGHY